MQLAGTRLAHHPSRSGLIRDTKAGPVWTGEVRFNEEWLDQPIRWRRPRMVFVCAHGDLFHESVPDEWIDRVFGVMLWSASHTFQVLTKRPYRARQYLAKLTVRRIAEGSRSLGITEHLAGGGIRDCAEATLHLLGRDPEAPIGPLPNVWLGVSVEDQARADERIPVLLDTPAAVRWISAEPLLGPVDLTRLDADRDRGWEEPLDALRPYTVAQALEDWGDECRLKKDRPALDWAVVGGESGRAARQMDIAWARGLVTQCRAAGVPVFVKQLGQLTIDGPVQRLWHHGKGGDPAEWPEDLRVREWPHA
jgi:protein gp37